MKIEGSFMVKASRESVWAAIKDPARIALCIPGCESIEQISNTEFKLASTGMNIHEGLIEPESLSLIHI